MRTTDRFLRLPLTEIKVARATRQRRAVYDDLGQFINNDGLLESIQLRGVLQPVIIDHDHWLKAGERRLEASRTLGLPDIICRFIEDMSPEEAEEVELHENLKRTDLPWRDEVRAVARLHALYVAKHPGAWTREDTGHAIGYSQMAVAMRVARDLDDPRIAGATNVRMAFNILARRDERMQQDAVADIMEAGQAVFAPPSAAGSSAGPASDNAPAVAAEGPSAAPAVPPKPPPSASQLAADAILRGDFREWAPTYAGVKFNLVHCDFPYSIGAFGGADSGRDRWETYDDAPDTKAFEELLICLCAHLDRFMTPSGHLMFWLPADVGIMHNTMEVFRELAPSLAFWTKPLIWSKTDNVGILSDPKRRPRHVYEAALVASREDRVIAHATSDWYGCHTDKAHHPSTKPEPMLRYFFQMFVDEHTRLLDPTCGSGSALRAAESLGAAHVFGIEASEEHHANAVKALRIFRTLREARKG